MATAYLLAFVDTRQWPPVITRAGIYSDGHNDITTDQRAGIAVLALVVAVTDR